MTISHNRTELIGRLGLCPELSFSAEGGAVARFSVATESPARGGVREAPDWHQAICFGKLAQFAGQYLNKGQLVFLAGRLTYRSFEGADGKPRRIAQILVSELIALERRGRDVIPPDGVRTPTAR